MGHFVYEVNEICQPGNICLFSFAFLRSGAWCAAGWTAMLSSLHVSDDTFPSTCSSVTALMGVHAKDMSPQASTTRSGGGVWITCVLGQVSSPPLCPCSSAVVLGRALSTFIFLFSSSVLEWYVQVKGSHLSPSLNVNSCFFHSILPGLLLYTY